MQKISVKALTQIALLIALEVILTRFFSIQTPLVRIGFGFLPIAMIAMLHGPLLAGISYAIGDIIGAMFLPIGPAPYFPGFTLSHFLTGVIFGLFLYSKSKDMVRIVAAVVAVNVFIRIGLTTVWLSILWEDAFIALLPARILAAAIMAPIQIICIRLIASERFYALFGSRPVSTN